MGYDFWGPRLPRGFGGRRTGTRRPGIPWTSAPGDETPSAREGAAPPSDQAEARQLMKSLLARWAEEQRRRLDHIEPGIWDGIKDRLPPRKNSEPPASPGE